MHIYVASKFENKEQVRAVQQRLKDAGHTISFDWTTEDASKLSGAELDQYFKSCAVKDYQGVLEADAILLLTYPGMRGAYTELGMAIAWGRVCYIVGDDVNIFYRLPVDLGVRIFPTIDAALAAIDDDEFVEAF